MTGGIVGDASAFDSKRIARRLAAVVRGHRVAAALGARRRPGRPQQPPRRRPAARRRGRASTGCSTPAASSPAARARATARPGGGAARDDLLRAALRDPPVHGPLERQLHRRDGAEGDRLPRRSGRARPSAGAAVTKRDLAAGGIPVAGVHIADGSGLSRDDRVTARELTALLVRIWNDPTMRQVVWTSLPSPGETGTLEHRLLDTPGHRLVRAKTGTTDIASALSGYVGTPLRLRHDRERRPGRLLGRAHGRGRRRRGALLAEPSGSPAVATRSASPRIGTPSASAFAAFEPGLSPTITPVVFFETLSDTFAPSASSAAFASSRVKLSSVPVITYWLPVSGPSTGRSSSSASKVEPERAAQLLDQRAVVVVGEPLGDRLGPLGADPLALDELLGRRGDQAVDRAEVAREVLRRHPADVGDVEPEEHAPERHRRFEPRSRRSRCGPRSRRSRRARSAARRSAGRGRASSAAGPRPRAGGRTARRRRRCRPPPAPS